MDRPSEAGEARTLPSVTVSLSKPQRALSILVIFSFNHPRRELRFMEIKQLLREHLSI